MSEELSAEQARRTCQDVTFDCKSTAELTPLEQIIGQDRAVRALQFGLNIEKKGFNVFVSGLPGTGRKTAIVDFVKELAALRPTPSDWCYVNNFHDPVRPSALRLPGEAAARLRDDMRQLVEELRSAIPAVLESDDYRSRVEQIEAHFASLQEQAFGALVEDAHDGSVQHLLQQKVQTGERDDLDDELGRVKP